MADIELVIRIPEEIRVAITRMGLLRLPDEMQKKVDEAIQRGTPLPKGHGRLIDMKTLQKFVPQYTEHDAVQLILADREDYIPTIIEADKANELPPPM